MARLLIFASAIALLLSACGNSPDARFSPSATRGQAPFTVTFANDSEGAVAYLWDFGDGSTSTEEAPSHTYTQAGEHTVNLTATSEGDTPATGVATQTITVDPGLLSEFSLTVTGSGDQKGPGEIAWASSLSGRGAGIRTRGLYVPNVARCHTAPLPDLSKLPDFIVP